MLPARLLPALYAAAATLAAPGLRLMLHRRARAGREIAARLPERRGIESQPRPSGPLLWLHAASVGESVSILPVLAALPPDTHVLMTTGTVTAAAMLAQRLPQLGLQDRVLHRFVPLDVPRWVARFLDHWRPNAAGFVESEIWPSLLAGCAARSIPMMLINARMSERSFRRWHQAPGLAQHLMQHFTVVQAQSADDATRLHALGSRPSKLTASLKFAAAPLPVDAAELARLRRLLVDRPLWLAAQTHPGEDAAIRAVHTRLAPMHPGLLTIVVPRHPARGPALAAAAGALPATRRAVGQDPPPTAGLWIADTLGELGLFYRLVGHAFVGKSLGEHGGHNPLEPARLGCAIAVGPNVENFAEPVAALEAAGALDRVADALHLADWVAAMLRDPAAAAAKGAAGVAAASQYEDLPHQVAGLLAGLQAHRQAA